VDNKTLMRAAISGMLAGLDPHSEYLDKKGLQELNEDTTGAYSGLGIEVIEQDGLLRIIAPIDDTPASRAGIKPGDVIGNYPLLLLLGIAFVGQFALGMLQSTFALYGEAILFRGYSQQATNLGIGLLLAVVGGAQFATQTSLLPRLLKRFGEATLVIAGTLVRGLSLAVFAMIASPWLGAVGAALFALGQGVMMPALQSLATTAVADDLRGGVLGLYQSSVSLSTIVSTAVAGVIFALNPTAPYWAGALLSFVALLPAIVLWRQFRAGGTAVEDLPAPAD